MNLLCKMTGHKWDRCKCVRCGETRDEGHEWLGCKCLICGRTRDEEHRWTYPGGNTKLCVRKCSRCGKTEKRQHRMENVPGKCYEECAECGYKTAPVHSWDGCRCTVCGEQRDQNHRWVRNGCTETCSICGKTRTDDSLHDWVREGCTERCSACGKNGRPMTTSSSGKRRNTGPESAPRCTPTTTMRATSATRPTPA